MRRHDIERFFIAYAVGALLGSLAFLLEVRTTHTPLTWGALAFYSLAAGLLAAVSRSVMALFLPGSAARMATAVVVAGFGALHLLYFANVKLLPAEPYYTKKSLAADAVILLALATPALLLCRSARVQQMRYRFGPPVAALGLGLLVATPLVLAAVWPPVQSAAERGGKGPDLLLIVLDSVRGDRSQDGREALRAMPVVHRMATEGRAYTEAFSSSSWTVPSVTHMLGAERAGVPTLAERLVRRGYATASFTDNPHLASGSPVLRGFDRVDRSVRRWRSLVHDTVVGEVIERLDPGDDAALAARAIAWASRRRGPYFMYVHLMDSHTPYRFPAIDGRRRGGRRIEFPVSGMKLTSEEAEDIVARYDGGVRSADAAVGRLLDAARASGRPFLAVITADHGESLGEFGRWFHGQTLAAELLAVPLVVLGQGVVPGRVAGAIGNATVLPTLLAAAGASCPECKGEDLRSQVSAGIVEGGLPPELAFRIAGRYKVVLEVGSHRTQLFDRLTDPAERHDLAAERADLAAALTAGLDGGGVAPRVQPSPEDLERLRALGYVGS